VARALAEGAGNQRVALRITRLLQGFGDAVPVGQVARSLAHCFRAVTLRPL
jgi:hypothetical protein